ncbi:MAG: helix-turn-helix domain-containing protein [Phocaeicola sp.]
MALGLDKMALTTQYDLSDFLLKRFDLNSVSPAGLTFLVLSGYSGTDWRCWPSYETLAARSGQGVRSVKRHIKILNELGLITMTKGRSNGAAFDHNIYTFNIAAILRT